MKAEKETITLSDDTSLAGYIKVEGPQKEHSNTPSVWSGAIQQLVIYCVLFMLHII